VSGKRAVIPRASDYSKHFLKDWERLSRSGRFDLALLRQVMLLLIERVEPLGPEWKDHPLKGQWAGHRECHVGGDFLLIYALSEDQRRDQVVFVRAGTHAELFGE
jgi:mRNA interferase YafQ